MFMEEEVNEIEVLKSVEEMMDSICNQYEECDDCPLWMEDHNDCISSNVSRKIREMKHDQD